MDWYKKAQENPDYLKDDIQEMDETLSDPNEITEDDIPKNNKGGDCYEVAGRYLMDESLKGNKNLILVHGEVEGQGPIAGIRYGHAWIEDGEMIVDKSGGRNIQLPKIIYYSIGNINPNKVFK